MLVLHYLYYFIFYNAVCVTVTNTDGVDGQNVVDGIASRRIDISSTAQNISTYSLAFRDIVQLHANVMCVLLPFTVWERVLCG